MKDFMDDLYSPYLTFTASLLRKCAKLYKDTAITIHNLLVHRLKQIAINPDIQEIDQIFTR